MIVYGIIQLSTHPFDTTNKEHHMQLKSYKDAFYNAARATDTVAESARYIHGRCPTFLDSIPEDVATEMDEGLALRFSEIRPAKVYSRIDGNLVESAKGKDKIEVTVFYAMSFTPQAFGAMRSEDPQLHGIIKGWRDAWSKYRSNRIGDVKREIKRLIDGPRTRSVTKTFVEYVADTLDTMVTRGKNAKARGDESVNLDLLNRQIAAFKAVK
jgi:hypothetical protein